MSDPASTGNSGISSKLSKIYLAGPGVFRPNGRQWGERLKKACLAHRLLGLYPLDGEVPESLHSSAQKRAWIFANNCELIRKSDAVFADLRAFRSLSEPDSGTAFELGFAHALGKPVWLWLPDCSPGTTLLQRVACTDSSHGWLDQDGLSVEDFSAPLNLMLWDAASGVSYDVDPETAIHEMAQNLNYLTLVPRET